MKKAFSIFGVLCLITLAISCIVMPNNVIPVSATEAYNVEAKSAILMDYASGQIIYDKNSDARLPVASMVKLMTILLTFENIDAGSLKLTDMVTTSEKASGMGGSQVFIDPFVQYSVEDLLKSVIIASANDASVALAEHMEGSEGAFVSRMNERAAELKMNNTLYKNCTGLPAPEQYSSAKDSAILLSELLKHEDYHKYSTIWMDKLTHPSGRTTELVNTNRLIRYYKGCDGGKTGSTNEAGYCLSASAKKEDMRLVAVVVGAKTGKDRFNECSGLFNYGFNNYQNKLIVNAQESVGSIKINKGKINEIEAYPEKSYYSLSKKGSKSDVEASIQLNQKINAPAKSGDVVGKILVAKNGKLIEEINIIIKSDLEAITYVDGLKKIINEFTK